MLAQGELFEKKQTKKQLVGGVCAASLRFILPGCRSNTFIKPCSVCCVKLVIEKKEKSVLYLLTLYLLHLLNTNCISLIVSQFFCCIYADISLESQSLYHSSLNYFKKKKKKQAIWLV